MMTKTKANSFQNNRITNKYGNVVKMLQKSHIFVNSKVGKKKEENITNFVTQIVYVSYDVLFYYNKICIDLPSLTELNVIELLKTLKLN